MEPDRRRIIYLAITVVVVIALGWAYYSNKKNSQNKKTTIPPPATVSNLTNLDPTDFDAAVKNEYAIATAKAAEVKPDYKIAELDVNVDKTLSVDSINTRYIFSAPSDTSNNWMITIAATTQSYIRALVPKDDYAGNVTPFDTSHWKYNYVTALQLAEKAGGLDWRNSNTLVAVKLTLKQDDAKNNLLEWIVNYSGADNINKTIILDATSGKAIQ